MSVPKWFYSTRAWRVRRDRHLAAHPCCDACGSDAFLQVHHDADPRVYGRSMAAFLRAPLQTLCRSCHSLRHKSTPRRRAWRSFVQEVV